MHRPQVAALEQLTAAAPTNPTGQFNLGLALATEDRHAEAIPALLYAAELGQSQCATRPAHNELGSPRPSTCLGFG